MIKNEQSNNKDDLNTSKNENDSSIELRSKHRKGTRKKSKTSNLGYKIGLVLDILAIAIFIYLAITINLCFLITLAITVPFGIFCIIKLKLCQGCSRFGNKKIKSPSISDDGFLYSETIEPEYAPNQNNISLGGLENNEYEKPVKIVTKFD